MGLDNEIREVGQVEINVIGVEGIDIASSAGNEYIRQRIKVNHKP